MFLTRICSNFNHQNKSKIAYIIYPNPAENDFWVRSDMIFHTIELINQDGRRIEMHENLNIVE